MDQLPVLVPQGVDLEHLSKTTDTDTKSIGMQFGVGISGDGKAVEVRFSVTVQQIILTPKEARRLSGMLRRMANACESSPSNTPPPTRSNKYRSRRGEKRW